MQITNAEHRVKTPLVYQMTMMTVIGHDNDDHKYNDEYNHESNDGNINNDDENNDEEGKRRRMQITNAERRVATPLAYRGKLPFLSSRRNWSCSLFEDDDDDNDDDGDEEDNDHNDDGVCPN